MPPLAGLDVLDRGDFTELKALNNPPENVKTVLSAVCVALEI